MLTFRGKRWLLGSAVVLLSLGMLACTAGAPGAGAPGAAPGQKTQLQLTTAGFGVVDPAKFPEPPEGASGWIPPADLTATPKRGGVVKYNGGFTRLDPHFPSTAADGRRAVRLYGSGLLKTDLKTNSPTLDLAEFWEEAPDKLSYTFKLRKGVKFHNVPPVNGRELKAEDVKWSLDRVSGLSRKPGQTSFNYARFDFMKEVQVIDDYTVRLVLKQPDNMFLREIAYAYSVILPKEAAIGGEFNEGKTLIGTGPFITELAQAVGLSRFKRNPDYFDKGPANKPYLDALEQHNTAAEALGPAFKTKQLDMMIFTGYGVGSYVALKPIITDPQLRQEIRIYSTRGNLVGYSGVSMNPAIPPLTDIRVRRAIHLAIDRDETADLAFGGPEGGYPNGYLGGYWQPWFWSEEKLRSLPGWRKNKEEDYAEARKLLAEAGYAGGLTVTCHCESVSTAEVLVQQLKRVGITLKVEVVTGAASRYTSFMKDKQMSNSTQGGLHTPDGALTQSFLCDSQKNMAAYCDQEIDRMWREFRRTFDQEKAVKILDQIQQRLYDAMVLAPTVRFTAYHVGYKYVRGWRNQFYDCCVAHGSQWANVWLDK